MWGTVLLAVSGTGHTPVIDGSISSYVVNVDVSAPFLRGDLPDLDIAPLPASSSTAPSPYDDSISDLSLNLVLDSILGSVGGIGATASASRDYGALEATRKTILTGLELSIAGKPIVHIDIPTTPNYILETPMLNLPRVSLIPNKQIAPEDDIISQDQAPIKAEPDQAAATASIPEPGTLAQLSAGFAILSWRSARKKAISLT